jgi:hypothetical protein
MMSVLPPGANGTIILMGLVGKVWATTPKLIKELKAIATSLLATVIYSFSKSLNP